MNLIRRSTWVVVMLAAVAGCSGDEGTTAPTGKAPAYNPPPAPGKTDVPGKEGTSKEAPAPAAKPEDGKKGEEPPKIEGPKTEGSGKGDTAAAKLTADELAAIKELPAAEQAVALKQAVCPVSDEHLGEMGKPVKVTLEGRSVYLCCDNCEKELKANPKKYLAKLDGPDGKK